MDGEKPKNKLDNYYQNYLIATDSPDSNLIVRNQWLVQTFYYFPTHVLLFGRPPKLLRQTLSDEGSYLQLSWLTNKQLMNQ